MNRVIALLFVLFVRRCSFWGGAGADQLPQRRESEDTFKSKPSRRQHQPQGWQPQPKHEHHKPTYSNRLNDEKKQACGFHECLGVFLDGSLRPWMAEAKRHRDVLERAGKKHTQTLNNPESITRQHQPQGWQQKNTRRKKENGGACATRTHDQLVKSQLLYRLS